MLIKSNSKSKNLIFGLLITLLIYMSGSVFFTSFNYSQACLLVFSVVMFFYFTNEHKNILSNQIVVHFLLFVAFMLLTILLSAVTNYSSYIAIFLQLVMSYAFIAICDFDDFKKIYVKIMLILAVVSLPCFLIILINPTFMLLFPKTVGQVSTDYYNAIIYVFQSAKGFSYFVPFQRNNGIFWEPGAYQAFLNLALLFLFSDYNEDSNKKYYIISIFIFSLTIITTGSTTGILLLLFIVFSNFNKLNLIFSKRPLLMFLLVIAAFAIIIYINREGLVLDTLLKKISNEFSNGTFLSRVDIFDINILLNPSSWLGMSFEKFSAQYGGAANSILHTAICLGIPFTTILLSMYYKFSRRVFENSSFVMVISLIIIFSSESLIWRPLFLILAWYGVSHNLTKNKIIDTHGTVKV